MTKTKFKSVAYYKWPKQHLKVLPTRNYQTQSSGAYEKWPKHSLNVLPTKNDQHTVYKYCLLKMTNTKFESVAYYTWPKQSLKVVLNITKTKFRSIAQTNDQNPS